MLLFRQKLDYEIEINQKNPIQRSQSFHLWLKLGRAANPTCVETMDHIMLIYTNADGDDAFFQFKISRTKLKYKMQFC